ncbi:MAG TPA: response regulator, partial [Ramlibacter sp.]|nr:response regulator [Ramlibacter sp.]
NLRVPEARAPEGASSGAERRISEAGNRARQQEEARTRLTGGRVLLVEDNEVNQIVAGAFLRKVGLHVDIASDGQSALERLAAGSYDVVLMDMHMPVLDGVATTRIIRGNAAHTHLAVIALTASVLPADRQRCLDAGMNDFIPKPFEPAVIWETLLKWVPAGMARRTAGTAEPA